MTFSWCSEIGAGAGESPLSAIKLGVRDSAGVLRFRGEDSFGLADFDGDGAFFLEAFDMRTSNAERPEPDIVIRKLGFDLVKFKKCFEDNEREGRRGSFTVRLRERETRIEVWRHDQSENINRG